MASVPLVCTVSYSDRDWLDLAASHCHHRSTLMRRDPIELEIFKNIYHSIAEEMGAALRRTAFSPNIKERRDYSCAIFDSQRRSHRHGRSHARASGFDANVGAGRNRELRPGTWRRGDAERPVSRGDPSAGHYIGGAGVHGRKRRGQDALATAGGDAGATTRKWRRPDFYVASRAHHADVGGTYPGSMGLCREIYQEGLRIPPVRIMRAGRMEPDVLALLLNNVRTPDEREGDLGAQIAACHTGAERLREICRRYGLERAAVLHADLLDYSEQMMRAFLARVPRGTYRAEDFMDSDGISEKPVKIAVAVNLPSGAERGRVARGHIAVVDFTGTDPQVEGSINAVEAITYSACFYVFRCLLVEDVPATAGLMRPIRVIAPSGTVVNARPPAAVAGGNVETSQRIVDVLLRALAQAIPERIPAAASGTMNNLTIGGIDPRTGEPFAYYETIAGGMGARPTKPGVSGVHTHMTNSLNTPAEALEYSYPLRVRQYSLRREAAVRASIAAGMVSSAKSKS